MVADGFLIWSGSPSFTGILHNQHSLNAKSPCSPIGNKDRKDNFCGTTLFAGRSGRSARCQHTGCPLTLAMRQKILWSPISPCPRRPICCPAFRSALSYAKLSVDAPAVLLPLQWFAIQDTPVIHQKCAFVKHYFSPVADNPVFVGEGFIPPLRYARFNIPAPHPGRCR